MDRVLLDTDVVLDFFFDRKPFSIYASAVISLCELGSIKGYITPVIISNTYYILRQGSRHDKVIRKLKDLVQIVGVLEMDKEVVINALNSTFNDFEDALQNFTAQKNGTIDVILTRNIKDYKNSKIAVMPPESYLKMFTNR
ncbi:MAG: PIN domain-containing protein [Cyclobacteriaceae bacterium]|nr:PIN domain-containing protein [Cyclobacteriaceae bacterium]